MKAIVNTRLNHIEMLECPVPEPEAGQVRIRTGACAICVTDLEIIAGRHNTGFPTIPGHEWSGTVDAVGKGVDDRLVGQRCVAENVLSDGAEVGFQRPGGYAQYFITDANNVYALGQDFGFSTASLIEPLAVSVRGMNRLRADYEEPVIVFGDGPIGLIMVQLLSRRGTKDITIVGGREKRLALAVELGAARALNYHKFNEELGVSIRQQAHDSFPTVIEASGSVTAIEAAVEIASRCGRVLVLGYYGDNPKASFLWNHLLLQEIEVIGSVASAGAWPEAVRLAQQKEISLDRLITHRLPADQFSKGFEIMRESREDVIKVVLEWE